MEQTVLLMKLSTLLRPFQRMNSSSGQIVHKREGYRLENWMRRVAESVLAEFDASGRS